MKAMQDLIAVSTALPATSVWQRLQGTLRRVNWLAISVGLVFLWFGALKFFPQLSPAEELARATMSRLTLGIVAPDTCLRLLAGFETGLGLGLIFNIRRMWMARLGILHLICTFTPVLMFSDQIFTDAPFGLTLTGQYIIKNVVLISALLAMSNHRSS
ncbi:MAG: hypothetical protein R3301_14355 [Saprospiraceae bacterium]|nr:hypothetical protein [Saprospiraceae bacterium]